MKYIFILFILILLAGFAMQVQSRDAKSTEQVDLLREEAESSSPSDKDFKLYLKPERIQEGVEAYQKIGLFAHLSKEQIDLVIHRVAEQKLVTLNDLLSAFPDLVYNFDTELSNLEDPYAELIRELGKLSHNDFKVRDISDDFNMGNKYTTLKFKIANKPYTRKLHTEGEWIDPEFFDFVQSVVTENKLKGQFYDLYTGGQDMSIIYLTKEQYDYLLEHKLAIFADQWREMIEE